MDSAASKLEYFHERGCCLILLFAQLAVDDQIGHDGTIDDEARDVDEQANVYQFVHGGAGFVSLSLPNTLKAAFLESHGCIQYSARYDDNGLRDVED